MVQSSNVVPITDLQQSPAQYLAKVHGSSEVVLITQRGRPSAMLVDPQVFEGMVATIEAMNEPRWKEKLRKVEEESRKGLGISHNRLKRKLLGLSVPKK